jgi:hypothetical protein
MSLNALFSRIKILELLILDDAIDIATSRFRIGFTMC